MRPNESFGGGGHRTPVCKLCMRLSRAQRNRIEQLQQLEGFLYRQSHISKKNLSTLEALCAAEDEEVRELAALVLAIARVKPHRRRRFTLLKRHRPDLLRAAHRAGRLVSRDAHELPDVRELEEDDLYAADVERWDHPAEADAGSADCRDYRFEPDVGPGESPR